MHDSHLFTRLSFTYTTKSDIHFQYKKRNTKIEIPNWVLYVIYLRTLTSRGYLIDYYIYYIHHYFQDSTCTLLLHVSTYLLIIADEPLLGQLVYTISACIHYFGLYILFLLAHTNSTFIHYFCL